MDIRLGDLFGALEAMLAAGKFEMDIEQAEKVADFIQAAVDVLEKYESKRVQLFKDTAKLKEEEKETRMKEFLDTRVSVPEFNFRSITGVRWQPAHIAALKRAQLFV